MRQENNDVQPLNFDEARSEAVMFQKTAEEYLESGQGIKILTLLASLSKKSVNELTDAINSSNGTEQEAFKVLVKVAQEIKNNPELLKEMITDYTHPRWLDVFEAQFSSLEKTNPKLYELHLQRTNLEVELLVLLGKERLSRLKERIVAKRDELTDPGRQYPPILNGTNFEHLALINLMAMEEYNGVSPEVWGKLLSLSEVERRLNNFQA